MVISQATIIMIIIIVSPRSMLLATCLILSSGRVNQSKIPELEIVGPKGYNYKGKKHVIGQIISKFTAYTVTDMDKNFNQK